MNRQVKTLHRDTIRGLLQKTINLTLLDLEQRELITRGAVIDWTHIRTFTQAIDILFEREIESEAERVARRNIIIEIRGRITSIIPGISNLENYEHSLEAGIRAYSRHIKTNWLISQPHINGFRQTLDDQFYWGLTDPYTKDFQIRRTQRRYQIYNLRITRILNQYFRNNGADLNFSNFNLQLLTTQQDLCWCLFNYKAHLPFYRTVLREYLELYYQAVQQELNNQGLLIVITGFIRQIEAYITEQCTHLHFNLERNTARIIANHRYQLLEQQRTMSTLSSAQLQTILNQVLGRDGLDINRTYQRLTTAIQNIPVPVNAQPRELSIVKIADFSGKDDEDPHEWMDSFERAAAANQWAQDVRKLAIVTGYMKDAAAAWATAAMAAGANNQITGFSGNLAATDFKDRFLEKFTPDSKQNKWYYELSTIRQRAEESVDEYSLRFQRLLRKVNRTVNNIQTIPPQLQVRMYLCGLNSLITPLVSISDPADLGAAIDHARTVETGYNFKTPLGKSDTKDEVDELTKKIEQLTLNYATIASALAVQPASNQQRLN